MLTVSTKEHDRTHSAAGGTKFPDSDARKSQTKIASPKLTRDLESGKNMTQLIGSVCPINTFNHTILQHLLLSSLEQLQL